jgi:hypothetical protein
LGGEREERYEGENGGWAGGEIPRNREVQVRSEVGGSELAKVVANGSKIEDNEGG